MKIGPVFNAWLIGIPGIEAQPQSEPPFEGRHVQVWRAWRRRTIGVEERANRWSRIQGPAQLQCFSDWGTWISRWELLTLGEAEKAGPLRLVDMGGPPLLHASHSRWAPYFSPHSLEYCHQHCVDVSTRWAHSDMLRTVQVSYWPRPLTINIFECSLRFLEEGGNSLAAKLDLAVHSCIRRRGELGSKCIFQLLCAPVTFYLEFLLNLKLRASFGLVLWLTVELC